MLVPPDIAGTLASLGRTAHSESSPVASVVLVFVLIVSSHGSGLSGRLSDNFSPVAQRSIAWNSTTGDIICPPTGEGNWAYVQGPRQGRASPYYVCMCVLVCVSIPRADGAFTVATRSVE